MIAALGYTDLWMHVHACARVGPDGYIYIGLDIDN